MSNVLAAIGRGQLRVLPERIQQRRAVFSRYRAAFANLPGIEPMPQPSWGQHTNWLSCFLIHESQFGASRDRILGALAAQNIEARPVWKPMHVQPFWLGTECVGGAVAEELFARGLCLPSSSSMSIADQDRVIDVVREQCRARAAG
jgi:pyridoxal phosphate-dependent aminotransferase EpsN